MALVAAACSSPTPSPAAPTSAPAANPTAAPTQAPAATQPPEPTATTVPPTETPAPPTDTPAPTPVAQIPAENLVQKTKLLICTDFPYPPQEFFDENGNPQGMDVDIGIEIANRLGLQVQFVNSVFDTIIAAVTSGKCDIILSAQNITVDRNKQVSMIPYFKAGQSFVAQKGNPLNIKEPMDLCGKSAAAESGTTEADYLLGTGDYKTTGGLTQECVKAGKPPVTVVVTQKDSDALQQLQAGKVAVYAADSPVAGYYTVQHPDQFEVVGEVLEPAVEGISVPCAQEDCTNAPLSPVGVAVEAALKSMMADGSYLNILTTWGLASGSIAP
jgi:polar amino acid transport system substrate-binding protein